MLSKDQFLDLYHRTTPEAAKAIRESGTWQSKESPPRAYFSTSSEGQAEGYGDAVVQVRVPEHLAELDDEFPSGERHYAVPVRSLRPHHII
jgi:hypothetical protein